MLDFGPGTFFLTAAHLQDSPSSRHGISSDDEKALRFYACEIIQEAGILLRLSQAVAATAQVLLHRFFCKQSFRDFDARSAATSCFWLAMKLEEEEGASNRGRKRSQIDDVVSMFEHIRARREGGVPLPPHSPSFKLRKGELLKLENRILVELGFVCHVEHPHKLLLGYLNCLEASKELVQECWNLVNDSLRTTMCVSFSSNVVACGIIYAAARRLSIPLPESPPWWLLFDVSEVQIFEVCRILADLYRQPKAQYRDVCLTLKTSELLVSPSPISSPPPLKSNESCSPEILSEKPDTMSKSVDLMEISCHKAVHVISPSSASESLSNCVVNASGPFDDVAAGGHTPNCQTYGLRGEKRKRRESDDRRSEQKDKRCSSRDHFCDSGSRRECKEGDSSRRHAYRYPDRRYRQRESSVRCSSRGVDAINTHTFPKWDAVLGLFGVPLCLSGMLKLGLKQLPKALGSLHAKLLRALASSSYGHLMSKTHAGF